MFTRTIPEDWRYVKVSKNFTFGEFYVSESYPDLALQMKPTVEQFNMIYLRTHLILQPIRDEFGPTKIESSVRDYHLNRAVGGVDTSQHAFAEADDITCSQVQSMREVYLWCIHELKWKGELFFYKKRGHLHIGMPSFWVTADQGELDK